MCLPPPAFLAFPWHFYAFSFPNFVDPYSSTLARQHLLTANHQLFMNQNACRRSSSGLLRQSQLFFAPPTLEWICWNFIHEFKISSSGTVELSHSRLPVVTWPPTKTIGGRAERSAQIWNMYFSLTFELLDDATRTQDCKTEETRRIYI